MLQPVVSIIVPTFNRVDLLQETLDSVLAQTYQNWECLVVDDGSVENNLKLVQEYSKKDCRIHCFSRSDFKKTKGANACRNIGIDNSNGDYLIFLDGDDVLLPHCLEQRIDFMKKNPNLDFAVFQMEQRDENLQPTYIKNIVKPKENYLYAYLSHDIPWQTTCPILKKEIILKVNGFDERFPRLQDPELFTKILLVENIKFKVLEHFKADCYYRVAKNKKVNLLIALTGFYLYYKKFYPLIKDRPQAEYFQKAVKSGCSFAYQFYRNFIKIENNKYKSKIKLIQLIIYAHRMDVLSFSNCIKRCAYIILKT